jgi:hypothetical protein
MNHRATVTRTKLDHPIGGGAVPENHVLQTLGIEMGFIWTEKYIIGRMVLSRGLSDPRIQ